MSPKEAGDGCDAARQLQAADIARLARPVFERYEVEKAILFGSFATGRQGRRSDVDLILTTKTQKPYFDRFEGLLRDLYRAIPGRERLLHLHAGRAGLDFAQGVHPQGAGRRNGHL